MPIHPLWIVAILVVVLIWFPAECQHGIADLGNHVVAPHQRLLIVAGFLRCVINVGNRTAVGSEQEEFSFDSSLDAQA